MNIEKIRGEFPILREKIDDKTPIIYFDNAATTQKPNMVIDKILEYYTKTNANIHRGVHFLSQKATDEYENVRVKLRKYINARENCEIIFTSGTTFGMNLLASSLQTELKKDDEIWVLPSEHHSNIVPWQFACQRTGAVLRTIPINEKAEIDFEEFEKCFSSKMKILSIQNVSNVLGNIFPVKQIVEKAKRVGAITIVDGAQSVAHLKIDVQQMDVDFYIASAHKMYGPTGVGFLYGRKQMLEKMQPYQGGGDMIKYVSFKETLYADLPYKFEAGTPNIEGVIAMGTAIDYINSVSIEKIKQWEDELLEYATEKLKKIREFVYMEPKT